MEVCGPATVPAVAVREEAAMTDGYEAIIRITDFAVDLAEVPETQAVYDDLTSVLQDLLGITSVLLFDTDGRLLSLATVEPLATGQVEMLGRLVSTGLVLGDDVVTEADLARRSTGGDGFGSEAAHHGIRSLAIVPLHIAGDRTGLLCLCSRQCHDWSDLEIGCAQCLSAITGAFSAANVRIGRQTQLAAQLQHALDARVVIEQAKGVLAATQGICVTDAFEQIRTIARARGVSVKAVADAIVNNGLRPGTPA
jgi:hypothetical protein